MDQSAIGQEMFRLATEWICRRYPSGWGGAAVIHTEQGHFYVSVAPETPNGGAQLCIETGAICEAYKYAEKVTHCLCVVREDETAPYQVLSPCGICQERLRYWGKDVQAGVTLKNGGWKFAALEELQPYHWTGAYPEETLEHYEG